MKNHGNFKIDKPCSEDFNSFSKTQKGGFCNSCNKEVIDFTKMSPKQTTKYIISNLDKDICGRFHQHQLQFPTQQKNRGFLHFISGIAITVLSLFSFKTSSAQEILKGYNDVNRDKPKSQDTLNQKNINVKGTVITSSDNLPLPGVSVVLESSAVGTQTDFDGKFEFPKKLKKGDVLIFSYIGMTSQKVVVQNEKSVSNIELKVDMSSCDMILMGKVATKEVYKSKPKN